MKEMIDSSQIFWRLPYGVRKGLYKIAKGEQYNIFNSYFTAEGPSGISWKKMKEHKFIFVHIPKTGGLSLTRSLLACDYNKHVTAKRFQLLFPEKEFKSFFKFCFVRNPWDRVVSAYLFLQKGGITESNKFFSQHQLAGMDTFESFVKNYLLERAEMRGMYTHFIPQYKYICDHKDKVLVDYIGRFENYDESCAYIFERLGLPYRTVKKENVNKERLHYREYYNDELMNIVANIYKKDIELLGYDF